MKKFLCGMYVGASLMMGFWGFAFGASLERIIYLVAAWPIEIVSFFLEVTR